MSQATMTPPRKREPMNGVNTPALFATIDAVNAQRELAAFQFRATTKWETGTHSRSTVKAFAGAGGEHEHVREFVMEADHPEVLVGADKAPLPVELLLAALGSCLVGGIGNIASARGVTLTSVAAHIEGDLDVQGLLGLSDDVRNGFQGIRVRFEIEGDAPAEKLEKIVRQSQARSAVFDVLTNGVPVDITVDAA